MKFPIYTATTLNYNNETLPEKMVATLCKEGVVMISDLPEQFENAVTTLISYGDVFFNRLESGKIAPEDFQHNFKVKDFTRVARQRDRFFGSFFANRVTATLGDRQDEYVDNIPKLEDYDNTSVVTAAFRHYDFFQSLFKSVLSRMEADFNLKKGELVTPNTGTAALGLSRYVPVTQERLMTAFQDKKLPAYDLSNMNLIGFAKHEDYCSLTGLIYRKNKSSGLIAEVRNHQGQIELMEIVPPDPNKITIILFAGRQLQYATNGNVRPLGHFVLIDCEHQKLECQLPPNEMRFMLACYSLNNSPELKPAITNGGTPIQPPKNQPSVFEQLASTDMNEFFNDHFSNIEKYSKDRNIDSNDIFNQVVASYPVTSVYDQVLKTSNGLDALPKLSAIRSVPGITFQPLQKPGTSTHAEMDNTSYQP